VTLERYNALLAHRDHVPVNERMRGLPGKVKRTVVVSAKTLKVFDGVHFDRQSQLILGRRYAEALLKMLQPER
jgi:hypothetical protein